MLTHKLSFYKGRKESGIAVDMLIYQEALVKYQVIYHMN